MCTVKNRVLKQGIGVIITLITIALIFAFTAVHVSAAEIIASGYCGGDSTAEKDEGSWAYKNVKWTLDSEGNMVISGNGPMSDFGEVSYASNGGLRYRWAGDPTYKEYLDSIKKLVINDGVTRIGENAFSGCENLESVQFSDTVTSIGKWAFKNASKLKSAVLPKYLDDSGLFFSGSGICEVTIPGTVETLGRCLFAGCHNLTQIHIENGVKKISYGAFEDCPIEELILPPSVIEIEQIFSCNENLKRLYIPKNVKKIETATLSDGAYFDMETWSTIPYDVYYEGSKKEWSAIGYKEYNPAFYNDYRIHYNSTMPSVPKRDIPSALLDKEVCSAIEAGLVPENLQKNYSASVTRGNVAEMFVNLLEKSSGKSIDAFLADKGVAIDENAFTDTADKAVLACNALGIINGIGNNRFNPDGYLTRAQAVAILNRIASSLGIETTGYTASFSDTKGHWCEAELGWAVSNKVINGTGNNKFSPGNNLTTEQAIALIYRTWKVLD